MFPWISWMTTRELLAQAIADSGMTMRQFAARMDCHHTHLGRVVGGRERIGPKAIGSALKVVDEATGKKLVRTYLAEHMAEIRQEIEAARRR
jgi:hypothetical protein